MAGGVADLIHELSIAVGEESVLRGRHVPAQLLDVGERGSVGEIDLAHGLDEIEEAGDGFGLLLDEIFVASLRRGCVRVAAEEGELLNDGVPARVDEVEAGVVGDEHEVEICGRAVGEFYRSEADLSTAI